MTLCVLHDDDECPKHFCIRTFLLFPACVVIGHFSIRALQHAAAGVDPRVAGLVYIAAVAPDAGETVQNQLDKLASKKKSRAKKEPRQATRARRPRGLRLSLTAGDTDAAVPR